MHIFTTEWPLGIPRIVVTGKYSPCIGNRHKTGEAVSEGISNDCTGSIYKPKLACVSISTYKSPIKVSSFCSIAIRDSVNVHFLLDKMLNGTLSYRSK